MRKALIAVISIALATAAFVGVSRAVSTRSPGLPEDFPGHSLPSRSLAGGDKLRTERLIGNAASDFGISDQSYTRVSTLVTTSAGPVFVVPGTSGVCLALITVVAVPCAVSCGPYGSRRDPPVSVFVGEPSSGFLVGAGLLPGGAAGAALELRDGRRVDATPVPGGFAVSTNQRVRPSELLGVSVS